MIIHPSLLQLTFQTKNIDVHYCPCASNVNHFFLSRDFHKKYLVVIHMNTLRIDIWVTHMCISTPASWITNVTEALFVAPFFESENAFTFRRTFHPIWLLLDGPPYEFARMAPPSVPLFVGILRIHVWCNRLQMTVHSLHFPHIGVWAKRPTRYLTRIIFRQDPVLLDAKRHRCYVLNWIVAMYFKKTDIWSSTHCNINSFKKSHYI